MNRLRPYEDRDPDPYAEGRRAPARKDTRRWCLGKVGREHRLELVMPQNHPGWRGPCRGVTWWEVLTPRYKRSPWAWWCHHAWVCSICKKVIRPATAGDCPDRPAQLGKA